MNITCQITTLTTFQWVEAAVGPFATEEEATAQAAQFPKSCALKVRTIWGYDPYYVVSTRVHLRADGVNGGTNEAGIKRLASIKRTATKLGIAVEETVDDR